ncbi:hypothetical protein [Streptomyces sp. NPDC047315]|uniref:hypothetical protein n=1 Tax=Streptomyces sp. NPDC047315 TaxID=3155142 RepID=UPI0033F86B8F
MRSRLRIGVLAATAAGALALTAAPASAATTPWQSPPPLAGLVCGATQAHAGSPGISFKPCIGSDAGGARAMLLVTNGSGGPVTASAQVRTAWGSNADCPATSLRSGQVRSCHGDAVPAAQPQLPSGTLTVNGITDHF